MNIYFVPFKVIPIRHYTLVITFVPILEAFRKIIFCDLVQLLLRCPLYLLNRDVASPFHEPLQSNIPY
uniref:Putative secreted protein n=1 Tax=Xenopsylla cheopis TaxID=163159 RepID=A0A6M2DZ26_XENCH